MIADARRIMTRSAGARNRAAIQRVVESADPGDLNRLRIEQLLSAKNARAPATRAATLVIVVPVVPLVVRPRIEEVKNLRCKWRAVRVSAQRIVDADKERGHGLPGDRYGAAHRAVVIQRAGAIIVRLRRGQVHLEIYDGVLLLWGQGRCALRMPAGRVQRLVRQVGL